MPLDPRAATAATANTTAPPTASVTAPINSTEASKFQSFGSRLWAVLVQSKVLVAADILERGYNLLLSDTDMTYFRNVNKTFSLWLRHTQADSALLTEESGGGLDGYINLVNTGSMLFLSNQRTRR